MSQDSKDIRHTTESIDETPEGFPICQWCGGAITAKSDLVVAAEETGVPSQIAPVGYTAPRTFTTFHRDCHTEAAEDLYPPETLESPTLWTPINVAIIGVTLVVILVVVVVAVLPQ
jgi:hypothetical protein